MAAPAPLGSVDDPSDAALTLADPLGALVLALMSRLLASRAVGAVAEGDGLRVEVVKGRLGARTGRGRLQPRIADDMRRILSPFFEPEYGQAPDERARVAPRDLQSLRVPVARAFKREKGELPNFSRA